MNGRIAVEKHQWALYWIDPKVGKLESPLGRRLRWGAGRVLWFWKLGTSSVREVLESLPEEERVAYTTVQTLVYRLEQKGALRKVKKIGNAQLFEPAMDRHEF